MKKTYYVDIDMKYASQIKVTAKSKAEAKKKAFERFKNKLHKKNFEVLANDFPY